MAKLTATEEDLELVEDIIAKVVANVSMLVDREIEVEGVETLRVTERIAGKAKVHISFKLTFRDDDGREAQGCVLVPLPDALSLACYLMMFPEGEVKAHRGNKDLDRSMKDAMLELGNFIGAAVDESLRARVRGTSARTRGCQGVRANVRPAFAYEEGRELVVGRAKARVHEFPPFELIVMLPALPLTD